MGSLCSTHSGESVINSTPTSATTLSSDKLESYQSININTSTTVASTRSLDMSDNNSLSSASIASINTCRNAACGKRNRRCFCNIQTTKSLKDNMIDLNPCCLEVLPLIRDYGVHSDKNGRFRKQMEDEHTIIQNFSSKSFTFSCCFFGIYDGHGGDECSKHVSKYLHKFLLEAIENTLKVKDYLPLTFHCEKSETSSYGFNQPELTRRSTEALINDHLLISSDSVISSILEDERFLTEDEMNECFIRAFHQMDIELEKQEQNVHCGSTALVCLIHHALNKRMVTIGYAGDSIAILSTSGKARRMITQHRVSNADEVERIRKAGGLIFKDRVAGTVSVTRAFGHPVDKEFITSDPEMISFEVQSEDQFLILVSDGISDVMNDDEIVDYIDKGIEKGYSTSTICKKLISEAKKQNSVDNMTVIIVRLNE